MTILPLTKATEEMEGSICSMKWGKEKQHLMRWWLIPGYQSLTKWPDHLCQVPKDYKLGHSNSYKVHSSTCINFEFAHFRQSITHWERKGMPYLWFCLIFFPSKLSRKDDFKHLKKLMKSFKGHPDIDLNAWKGGCFNVLNEEDIYLFGLNQVSAECRIWEGFNAPDCGPVEVHFCFMNWCILPMGKNTFLQQDLGFYGSKKTSKELL